MIHARQTIREAARLAVSGIAGVAHVESREYSKERLPALSAFTEGEGAERENEGINANRRYSRRLELVFEYSDRQTATYQNEADSIIAEVESRIAADHTLGGVVTDITLIQTTQEFEQLEQFTLEKTQLRYLVWYRTDAKTPQTVI